MKVFCQHCTKVGVGKMCTESSFLTLLSKVIGGNNFLREIDNCNFSLVLANSIVHTPFSKIAQIIIHILSYIKPYLKWYVYHSWWPQYFLVCYLCSLHTPPYLVHLSMFCCMTMTNHLLLKMKFYPSDLQQTCDWEPAGNTKTII